MFASTDVAAAMAATELFAGLSWAGIVTALIVLIVCCTVVVLSRINKRPPRLRFRSFSLSFDKDDRDA